MNKKENGGPAFSGTYSTRSDQGRGAVVEMHDKGMSLRDYFAAKAMQGFMANKARPMNLQPEDDAQYFYAIADAMLAERAK